MPELERLRGTRIVADPAAIDSLVDGLPASTVAIRSAPDDVVVLAVDESGTTVADPHAIVEDERGLVGGWCSLADVAPHAEWSMPRARPALAQGSIAGVPAKLWIVDDDHVLVVAAAAYAAVLAERLGWPR